MLEHQSRADAYMALRMATYTGLLYQSLLRQKLIVGRLPPILPVVLYSGRRPWRAHQDLASLIEPSVVELSSYQLQLRYLLIDEGELLRAGGLPEALIQRIRQGTASELEAWSLNFVEANSLEQVFTTEKPGGKR